MIDFIISKLLASPNRFLSPIEEAALILECAIDGQKLQDETVTEKIRFCYRWRKKVRLPLGDFYILHNITKTDNKFNFERTVTQFI